MNTITYEQFLDVCKSLDVQPNRLFACFRRTLGISQAKLAYILDTNGINQNTISKYEHKYIVTADVEYVLWKWLVKELNKYNKPSKKWFCKIRCYIHRCFSALYFTICQ